MYFEYGDYLKTSGFYKEMLDKMRADVDCFKLDDDPRFFSQWGHNYFCNEDGAKLVPDGAGNHLCGVCGKNYRGFMYDGCTITFSRNDAIVTSIKAALLYNIYNEEKYLKTVMDILNFYIENYDRFPIHSRDKISNNLTLDVGGAGKIMPQGLNEAIICIRIINALELIKGTLSGEWLDNARSKLFKPVFELLSPQKNHIHNIPTWINSTIGVMGFFFDDKEWIKEATENSFNIYEQLEKGVTEDGFWYEGSIFYNFFALEGVMNFLVFAEVYDFEIKESAKQIVLKMLKAAYNYAFDNDMYPNPSDGWPGINMKSFAHDYYMAYKVFKGDILLYLQHIEENNLPRGAYPLSEPFYYKNAIPLERLMFAPDIHETEPAVIDKRGSAFFEKYNCNMLRNEYFNVFLKHGHQIRSHAHPDKMNVEILINNEYFTKDLSNAGYGSLLCNGWHRRIGSHNTCAINGLDTDLEKQGELVYFDENKIIAKAPAYEDTVYTREIELNKNILTDTFTVAGSSDGTVDWFYHFEPTMDLSSLKLAEIGEISLFDSYKYIIDVKEIMPGGNEILLKAESIEMKVFLTEDMRAFICKSYGNPANKYRTTLILRKTGGNAIFKNIITYSN